MWRAKETIQTVRKLTEGISMTVGWRPDFAYYHRSTTLLHLGLSVYAQREMKRFVVFFLLVLLLLTVSQVREQAVI